MTEILEDALSLLLRKIAKVQFKLKPSVVGNDDWKKILADYKKEYPDNPAQGYREILQQTKGAAEEEPKSNLPNPLRTRPKSPADI